MKTWLLALLLSLSLPGWRWLLRVRDYNAAQLQGQQALQRGQPAEAAYYFGRAAGRAGRGGPSPALLLSLAQAQAQAGQQGPARTTYARLLGPAVPAPVGSAARQQLAVLLARQGQAAQAIGLLRQALRLDPANATARFDYEALSAYLAGQRPPTAPTPPPAAAEKSKPNEASQPSTAPAPDPAAGGTSPSRQPQGQPGAAPNATRPQPEASGTPAPVPTPGGGQLPTGTPPAGPGTAPRGGSRPGAGPEQPVPSGRAAGQQRGLDLGQANSGNSQPAGRGQQPGRETATDADAQLQTQRERLKAMNLSPGQAQQLLDALRASEQQYLQQRPRARRGAAPAPGTPTW